MSSIAVNESGLGNGELIIDSEHVKLPVNTINRTPETSNDTSSSSEMGASGVDVGDSKHLKSPPQSILKTPETSNDTKTNLRSSREVTFDNITIRSYHMEIGDHPCCSIGPPIGLSWEFDEESTIDLDIYECERKPRRQLRHLVLSYYRRRDILRNAGFSEKEIQTAAASAARIRRQRESMRFFQPLVRVDEIVRSVGRKAKKAVRRKSGEV